MAMETMAFPRLNRSQAMGGLNLEDPMDPTRSFSQLIPSSFS